ncbi:MAG TPA: MauE/DoxX family redox-associated membrane protein [Ktedonosporobacter sp.]|nr:MauE/DoxX family redox-associated membrane protein [Ktedonosporobacter sp.]
MSLFLLFVRLLLALVFIVAGLAKLADLAGSQQALRNFGVPTRLAAPLGLLLPLVELVVAIALLPSAWAWFGAIEALALLLIFVAGISYNLARGRTPDCHCFGQLHSAPAGPSTLIRNLVLAALAGVVVGFGRSSADFDLGSWFGSLALGSRIEILGGAIMLAALVGEGWLLWHVLLQQGRLLLRLETLETRLTETGLTIAPQSAPLAGLEVGYPAPAFSLADAGGQTHNLQDLLAGGKPLLLLFAEPSCGPCTALFPEVGRWQHAYQEKLTLAVISRGSQKENQGIGQGVTRVLLQKDREVQTAYQVTGTPSLVLIRPDGTIGSRLAQGAEVIRGLVANAVRGPSPRSLPMASTQHNGHVVQPQHGPLAGAQIGEPAPDFSLLDLDGKPIHLSDFVGAETLLLFWRPGCGFCQRMLADLKAWEAQPPEGAPQLLVVSSESVESNRAMELRSPVVLDQAGMSIGMKYGATGTPMAVLVDAESKIASELAAGAPAVLALANRAQKKSTPA